MYIAHLDYATATKNNLEASFYEYLRAIDRTLIDNDKINDYQQMILDKYDELCKEFSRCKPIEKHFSSDFLGNGDFQLFGSNATFTLLKSK